MSVKKHTQKEIGAYLKEKITTIFFDKYRGQLDNPGMFTFPIPAVFMSFGKFDWERGVNGFQRGSGVIKFRNVVENYAEAFEGSVNQELALAFFDFNEEIHTALQGLSGTYFEALERISDEDDEDHGNLIVTVMEYRTTLIDNSANVTKNYELVDPELQVQYVKKEDLPAVTPEYPIFIVEV